MARLHPPFKLRSTPIQPRTTAAIATQMEVAQQVRLPPIALVSSVYKEHVRPISDILILRTERFLWERQCSCTLESCFLWSPLGIVATNMLVDDYQALMDRGWRK